MSASTARFRTRGCSVERHDVRQRFYQKASVQVAIVSGIGLIVATLIMVFHQRSQLKSDNKVLERRVAEKTAEIQRIETLLTPFRTIALEKYTGDEKEALRKLADYVVELQRRDAEQAQRIQELEEQTRDLDKFKTIAAKHEYRPLSPEMRIQLVDTLAGLKDAFAVCKMSISITQETWTPATTREFTSQLAKILKDAGLEVSGPEFVTVYLASQSYPLEWGYSEQQIDLVNQLFQALAQIMQSPKQAKRATFPKGKIRIHFAGHATFDNVGRVVIE